jgi:3-oxoacyl-[acyl-carrier protein] reductase
MAGEVALLTGCASGIGLHLVGVLADRGGRVVATDIDETALSRRAVERGWDPDRVQLRRLDVRSAGAWEEALDVAERAWGGVDVVMNIAGVLRPAYVRDLQPDDVDLHLAVNVTGTVLGTRAAARRMIPRGTGHIVNFGSLASLAPVPGLSLYSASKFAVRGFSLAAATELREHGVAVSVIMPDAVQTPMLDLQVDYEEAALTFSGDRPLTVDEIGRLIVDVVLPRRPMEVAFPPLRAFLARVANSAPAVAQALGPRLTSKGRRVQEGIKRRQGRSR